jgi:hypothetical protein
LVIGLLAFAAVGSTATVVRLPYVLNLDQSAKGRDGDFLCKSHIPTKERVEYPLILCKIALPKSLFGQLSRTALASQRAA